MGTVAQVHSADVGRALESYRAVAATGDADAQVIEVSREELLELLDRGEVVVLDVRPEEEFAAGHIPGAVSMPLGRLVEADGSKASSVEIPEDREVVAYCRGAYCVMAHDAVRLLLASGRTARRLEDGLLEWRLAGLPVAVGA
jgi:rhodanese-related sulfurtransferase